MKLKGLGTRAYNILFHTHTVSGIVISVALYIIFFAGAFTLFRDEFYQWENPKARIKAPENINLEKTLEILSSKIPNIDWNDDLRLTMPSSEAPHVNVFGHLQHKKGEAEQHFEARIHPSNFEVQEGEISTIGETLYRLHFLDQIPLLGRYIAGFVSLFFLFASLTGLLIHWRNILTKFWGISFKNSLKQIWTNSHTVLGLLGLPFQMMYAVTGAFYMLLILILLPAVMVFYNGDTQKVYALVQPGLDVKYDEKSPMKDNTQAVLELYTKAKETYPDLSVWYISFKNLQKADGTLNIYFKHKSPNQFDLYGAVGYRLASGEQLYEMIPGKNKNYVQQVIGGIGQLHFATFGGLLVKVIYFLMALLTCFVIISGVLLWKEARKNKNYTLPQQRFHHRVTLIYLAICLSLFPATSVLFMAELIIAQSPTHVFWVNTTFFGVWLALFGMGLISQSESTMTRFYLLTGGILSLGIPLTNGLTTGDWVWVSFSQKQYYVFATDMVWLMIGLFVCFIGVSVSAKKQSHPLKIQSLQTT